MSKARTNPAGYPIRAVSKMTGIGIDTLRAWERRYGAVTPTRDDRGRMYTEADVARLRLLNRSIEQGHSIGRVAGLSNDELHHLCGAAGAVALPAAVPPQRSAVDTTSLLTALRQYDAVGIDQELSRMAAVLRPLELLQDVLMPLLTRVGDDWHSQRTRIAHEHLMSSTMRNLLGAFLRLYGRRDASVRLVFATPLTSATRSRRWARRCWRRAPGSASPTSGPICRLAKSSTASSRLAPRCWCLA